MIKRSFKIVDYFLPSALGEFADPSLQFRVIIIASTNLISLITAIFLLFFTLYLKLSWIVHFCVLLCIFAFIGNFIFLRMQKNNKDFERRLEIGTTVQIILINLTLYVTSFMENGMGFFALIWQAPVFLMMCFYFKKQYSFFLALFNIIVLILISYIQFKHFYEPIKNITNFDITYVVFLVLAIILTYLIAFLFVNLNDELQKEIAKQKDLLFESAKFQSLGKMASNLAHDINNPLFTIQGKLHQMRNLLSRDQLDLEKCDQIVEGVEATILKLSQMVKGISTFAREGKGDHMISITVGELIESNLVLAMDRIKNAEIDLKMEIDPEAEIICYPSFMSQILVNLLNNAIDALENSTFKQIQIHSYKDKNWVYIRVCDTGLGVSKDIEKKIFEPFFTTKTFGKGTGLGLSISKGLIEVHEGELTYERNNQYTCFLIKLPSYE